MGRQGSSVASWWGKGVDWHPNSLEPRWPPSRMAGLTWTPSASRPSGSCSCSAAWPGSAAPAAPSAPVLHNICTCGFNCVSIILESCLRRGSVSVSRMPGLSYYWLGSMSWNHWASWTIVYLKGRSGDGFCSYPVQPHLPLHGALHWRVTRPEEAGSGEHPPPIHPCSVAAPPHDLMQRHFKGQMLQTPGWLGEEVGLSGSQEDQG